MGIKYSLKCNIYIIYEAIKSTWFAVVIIW